MRRSSKVAGISCRPPRSRLKSISARIEGRAGRICQAIFHRITTGSMSGAEQEFGKAATIVGRESDPGGQAEDAAAGRAG